MNREETIKLVRIIQASFPKWEVKDKTGLVDVWTMVCADDDFEVIQAGLKNYILNDTSGFAPSIGQIRNGVRKMVEPYDDTEELIGLLRKAIKNGNYGYEEEYDLLPPTLQKAIGCAENIRAWAAQPIDQFESVTLSAVRRAIRATKERENNLKEMIPMKNQMLEVTAENVKQLEAPKATPEQVQLPPPKQEEETKEIPDEQKEAILKVWNRDGRQMLFTFHFKAPSYRDTTMELIKKMGLEQFLRALDEAKDERYLNAIGEFDKCLHSTNTDQ